jgi:hypothetical protein
LPCSRSHWFGSLGFAVAIFVYVLPTALWALASATAASLETKHTYRAGITPATFLERFGRIFPQLLINTGMLPHQFSSFAEGLFGPLHSEFERTPKAGTAAAKATAPVAKKTYAVKVHWPYVLTEAFFVAYQLGWGVCFATNGLALCAIGAFCVAACVVYLGFFYGDHAGKVCFAFDRRRMRIPATAESQ